MWILYFYLFSIIKFKVKNINKLEPFFYKKYYSQGINFISLCSLEISEMEEALNSSSWANLWCTSQVVEKTIWIRIPQLHTWQLQS